MHNTTSDTSPQFEIDAQACYDYLQAIASIVHPETDLWPTRPDFGEYVLQARNAENFVRSNKAGVEVARKKINNLVKDIPPLADIAGTHARVDGEADPDIDPHILSISDLRRLPKPEWLIYKILPAKGISFLAAAPKAGKTYLTVTLAGTVALEPSENLALDLIDSDLLNWAGQVTRHGDVMYIAAEAIEDIAQRVFAWAKYHHIPDSALSRFHFYEYPLQLATQTDRFIEALDRKCKGADFKLIVVDTLAMCSLGIEENSKKELDTVYAALEALWRKYNCCVLVVHHTGRNGKIRGSSSMDGITYNLLTVEQVDEHVVLKSELQRRGKNFDPIYFDWQTVELDYLDETGSFATESILIRSDWKAATKAEELTKNQQIILDVIKVLGGKNVARSEVEKECTKAKGTEKAAMSKPTFISATDVLIKKKNLIDVNTHAGKYYYTLQGYEESGSQDQQV